MKTFCKLAIVMALVALPGLASATTLSSVTGTADCDGFEVIATIHWGSAPTGTLSYEAVLTGDGGPVATISDSHVLTNPEPGAFQNLAYTGMWGVELCGTYTATVTVTLVAPTQVEGQYQTTTGSFTQTVVCDCPPPPDSCNYTPGYWKNHEENWPVMELALGGVTYSQAELLDIMDTPVRGDATIILAYHLIAAKLNVLSGSDPSIDDAIAEADDLLAMYPLFSAPTGEARDMILSVKNDLAAYNELGCDDGMDDSADKTLPDEAGASWSQLKANYR